MATMVHSSQEMLDHIVACLPHLESAILKQMRADNDTELVKILDWVESQHAEDKLKYKVVNLVVSRTADICHGYWMELFKNMSTDKMKAVVKEGVSKMDASAASNTSLTYGEIDFFSFANILDRSCPKQGDIFVDLGHGTGKGIVCASLLYGPVLSECRGIEIVPELQKASEDVVAEYRNTVLSQPMFESHNSCAIRVEEGDILTDEYTHWTEGDIVFANSTCFEDTLMRAMGSVAERMKPGSRFISLTKQIPSPEFTLVDRRQYVMSWGEATCFICVRKPLSENSTNGDNSSGTTTLALS